MYYRFEYFIPESMITNISLYLLYLELNQGKIIYCIFKQSILYFFKTTCGQIMKKTLFLLTNIMLVLFMLSCESTDNQSIKTYSIKTESLKNPEREFNPEHYICYKAEDIIIDGTLNEISWESVEWTSDFRDIEGDIKADPLFRTRAKIIWDNDYLYVAAEITEPHIWAKLTKRDTVIFYDNDFEVFFDPDGDTHNYMEFEMNAINTVWDLFLLKPYRDGGGVINSWTINGMKSAIKINGTINDPDDIDDKWTVELAFPLVVLTESGSMPSENVQWRLNFSRVNWKTTVVNGEYVKAKNADTGKNYPEFNWVWSPQGVINMHYPETWGFLQFTETVAGQGKVKFNYNEDETVKWKLRTLYYAQREYASKHNKYCNDPELLKEYGFEGFYPTPEILIKAMGYEANLVSPYSGLLWTIDNTGRIYSDKIIN